MSPSTAVLTDDRPAEPIVLQTRFGEMTVDPSTVLRLPRGLMGFASLHEYALASLPEERYGRFKVLQSIDAADVSFIVLPYDASDSLIAEEDLDAARADLGIAREDAATLLIVSIRRAGEAAIVSVNLRAPVVIDLKRRTAWQYVLANPEYSVRHGL